VRSLGVVEQLDLLGDERDQENGYAPSPKAKRKRKIA
jgi:hypothetical protein